MEHDGSVLNVPREGTADLAHSVLRSSSYLSLGGQNIAFIGKLKSDKVSAGGGTCTGTVFGDSSVFSLALSELGQHKPLHIFRW